MAKIIVTADGGDEESVSVLFEESVHPLHLSNDHSARQLMERLRWAVSDADSRGAKRRPRRTGSTPDSLAALAELSRAQDARSSPA